jgi:hypothetical protein
VRVLHGPDEVARHTRSWSRRQVIEDPAHLEGLAKAKRKARGNTGRERLLAAVPSAADLFAELATRQEPMGRETAALLLLLDSYGPSPLAKAIAEALERGTPRAASVAHLLAQNEPDRKPRPIPPLLLSERARLADITVRNHPLEDYDAIHHDHS